MIKCRHCGHQDLRIEVHKGVNVNGDQYEHHKAYCLSCGKFSHNVSHQPQRFYFGKYKGKLVDEVEDVGYLEWFLKETNPKPSMREAVEAKISQIEFSGR